MLALPLVGLILVFASDGLTRDPRYLLLAAVGTQWAWILGMGTLASLLWRAGIRRYQAFGG